MINKNVLVKKQFVFRSKLSTKRPFTALFKNILCFK